MNFRITREGRKNVVKRILLLFCMAVSIVSSLGQELVSQKLKGSVTRKFMEPVSMIQDSSGYYTVKNNSVYGASYYALEIPVDITRFDSQMKEINTARLFTPDDKIGPFPSHFEKIDGKVKLIYYKRPNSREVIEIYVADINPEKLVIENAQKIIELPQKTGKDIFKSNEYTRYRLFIQKSPDNQKTLFLWTCGANNQYTYSVTDKDLKVIKTKTEDAPSMITVSSACIDNEGAVFVAYYYIGDKRRVWNVIRDEMNNSSKSVVIDVDNITPVDVYLSHGMSRGKMRICGSYTVNGFYISGAFMQTLDARSMSTSETQQSEIPVALMDRYVKEGYSKKSQGSTGLEPIIKFKQLVLDKETVCLTGEISRTTARLSSSGVSEKFYVRGSILSILFKQRAILFVNVFQAGAPIPVYENNRDGFFPFVYNDKAIFLYFSLRTEVDDTFLPLLDQLPKNKRHLLASIITKNGESIPAIVKGQIPEGIFEFENTNFGNGTSILIPSRKSKGIGLKEIVMYHLIEIK